MDTKTGTFFTEIEKKFEDFRMELSKGFKEQIEEYLNISKLVNEAGDAQVEEMGDLLLILKNEELGNYCNNPDQVTQLFENLKESLDTKLGEKRNAIENDRKANWDKIDKEI